MIRVTCVTRDMSSREQTWSRELQDLFSYSPPAVQKAENPVPYQLPFTFFDRHIDSHLSLRRVVSVPSFTSDIAEVIDQAVLVTKNEGGRFPVIDYEDDEDFCALISKSGRKRGIPRNILTDAVSVGSFYSDVSFLYCAAIGSTLALNPHSHTWLSVFIFNSAGVEPDAGRSSMTSRYYLEIQHDADTGNIHIPKGVWDALDDDARMDITEVSSKFERLVTYQFYAATTEYGELLENMGDMDGKEVIAHFSDAVSGFQKQEMPQLITADSTILPWRPKDSKDYRTEGKEKFESLKETSNDPSPSKKEPAQDRRVTVKKSTAEVDDVTAFVKHVSMPVRIFPFQANIYRHGLGLLCTIQPSLFFIVENTSVLECAIVQLARYSFLTSSTSIAVETQDTARYKPDCIY